MKVFIMGKPKVFNPKSYVVSDLHLGHSNIIKYTRTQFKTIEDHDDHIISILSHIPANETLFILGDVAFKKSSMEKLLHVPCRKILIAGNHDHFSPRSYEPYFYKVYGVGEITHTSYSNEVSTAVLTHIPIHPAEMRWNYNIHGHCHVKKINDERYINVTCEHLDFVPWRMSDLIRVRKLEVAEKARILARTGASYEI